MLGNSFQHVQKQPTRDILAWSYISMFLGKGVMKICRKFAGEHPCRSAISIKLLFNLTEITLWHGCSPVNLLYIFRTLFPKKTSGGLLLHVFPRNLSRSNPQAFNDLLQYRLEASSTGDQLTKNWTISIRIYF